MSSIITERQVQVLDLYAKANQPMGSEACVAALGGTRQSQKGVSIAYALDMLIASGLLERTGRKGKIYVINAAGRAALADYRKRINTVLAQPLTHNTMGMDYITPSAYYRNNGNVNIPSRGMQC